MNMKLYIPVLLCAFVCRGLAAPWYSGFWNTAEVDGATTDIEAVQDITSECLQLGNWGQCAFYDCIESRFPCGSEGYTQKISKHFCNKIDSNYNQFDAFGKRWLNQTSICLVRDNMVPIYTQESTTCEDIKNAGINAIVECNNGMVDGQDFCDFLSTNGDAYQGLMGMTEVKLLASLGDTRVWTSMIRQAVFCGVSSMSDTVSSVGETLSHTAASIAESIRNLFN